ncbi:MAG: UvrD-helicase domain-containing protein [Propionibacterium sp.]|nr:UvrD-helicase domain-containing protein [Propionibacterium sp.]
MNDILAALDPEQREVATTLDAPVVVLAGAGTGKTRAITHRVAHAVSEGVYDSRAVLAVTFTTRAAGEMRARLAGLGVRTTQARTIHSAALRQCRYFWPQAYGSEFPEVAENTFGIVARAANHVVGESETALIRDLETEISWAKSSNVTPETYPELAAGRAVAGASPTQVAAVMATYEKAKRAQGVVDFHDLLLCNAALLTNHAEVAEQIRAQYRHFVVDEYQDVSAIQHRLVSLWVDGRDDLCVVGDPNQAIHSFAGADPRFLREFAREHDGAHTVRLVRNYRSTPEILKLGNHVLRPRASEQLRPTRPSGPAPQLLASGTAANEAQGVADWVLERRGAGTALSELAVLYRINAQSPALEAAFDERNIPYTVRGTERFYERGEVRQAVAQLQRHAEADPDASASEVLTAALQALGWSADAPAGQGRQRERWESVAALKQMLEDEIQDDPAWTAEDASVWLRERASWQHSPVADAVTLSTMHAAKGLEWDDVAVIGVREGLVPFSLAQGEDEVAEERRLLYVACTRARNELRISWNFIGGGGKQQRSRFLSGLREARTERARPRETTSLKSRPCLVCGRLLATPAERKLRRHEDCALPIDEALFESLRAWRKRTADEASVPAFVVFTDATLMAIAEAKPSDERGLLALPGIGRGKLTKYGDEVLGLLREHG